MTDPATIAKSLTKAQREYIQFGPYPHWTQTRWALERRELVRGDYSLSPLGLAVRAILENEQ